MTATLTDKRIVHIVGVGALGSHVAQFLRNEHIIPYYIDFDRVETKNTSSQFYSKRSTGKYKTAALLEQMNFLWGVRAVGVSNKLVDNNIYNILGSSSDNLVIDCLDNAASRRLVQDHVRKFKQPCIHGGLAADGAFGQVIWDHAFKIDEEGAVAAATCEDGEHLPFITVVASMLAYSVSLFLKSGKKIGFAISPGGIQRI